ncbi:Uma2 family endonuclease [Thiohalocapsa marina]|uniref:Uma2 family endonuclease n=1 Tax=Thiohalocapsa marina TaxID=424902 RepID=A0A5M8FLI2_9GAMM|nr:Uma2 family endonuclease [Thiohalocapsa marina]KAA6181772.1 Uma2 family endonuclease [Thiohalocapsa marina]
MEAGRLLTVDDLLACPGDDKVELIDGAIVQRPMSCFEHGFAQSVLVAQSFPLVMRGGPGGWWIASEISVRYSEHHCPTHDLAGWRKERLPEHPSGVMTVLPDWVCEILSPGHERKDTLTHFLRLQRAGVPFYRIIDPEDRALIAYGLDAGCYRTLFTAAGPDETAVRVRVPPFDGIEIDLGILLGDVG